MFSKRVKELRKKADLTQSDLAKKINSSTSKIAMWETEKRDPTNEDLMVLSKLFNVSTDYLLGIIDNPSFTTKDDKSIQKDLKKIMEEFKSGQDGPAFYNGEELDEEELYLIEQAMEIALKTAKIKNKEKYTPKKYKK